MYRATMGHAILVVGLSLIQTVQPSVRAPGVVTTLSTGTVYEKADALEKVMQNPALQQDPTVRAAVHNELLHVIDVTRQFPRITVHAAGFAETDPPAWPGAWRSRV